MDSNKKVEIFYNRNVQILNSRLVDLVGLNLGEILLSNVLEEIETFSNEEKVELTKLLVNDGLCVTQVYNKETIELKIYIK